ncbi:LOW QUALITY PROTEIN: doublecortin domain-containing protein 2 [Odontesthes bonariensis]
MCFFPGRKTVVNPRQVSTFENFLNTLTNGIEAPFGAVRRLYTPTRGRILQHLEDLKQGGAYVAGGNEPLKQLDVFTNGDFILVPAARIPIPKHTLKSWEKVLAMVTKKVNLRTGAFFRLYTLDGQPVHGPTELESNHYYAAVGSEKFKPLPYDQLVPSRDINVEDNTIKGNEKCCLCQDILPAIKKKRSGKNVRWSSSALLNGTSGLENVTLKLYSTLCSPRRQAHKDLEHTARGQMKKHTAKPERAKQQRQVSRNPALLTTGASSVFSAQNKRSDMAGAAEVHEGRQLKVDLPIDQVEAEIVEEEQEESCSASRKASLQDSDSMCLQLTAGFRSNVAFRVYAVKELIDFLKALSVCVVDVIHFEEMWTRKLIYVLQEAKGREVSHRLSGIPSRMSRFFKETDQREIDGLVGLQHLFCYEAHGYQTMAKYDCPGALHVNVKDKHRVLPSGLGVLYRAAL